MKFKLIIIAFFASMMFVACDDTQEPVADFSDTKPVYVELTTKSTTTAPAILAVKEGATATLQIRLREGQQQDVVVGYEVTGAFTKTGSATIARNSLTGNISLTIPTNVVPLNATTADAVLTLKSATMGGQNVTVGFPTAAGEKRTIRISR